MARVLTFTSETNGIAKVVMAVSTALHFRSNDRSVTIINADNHELLYSWQKYKKDFGFDIIHISNSTNDGQQVFIKDLVDKSFDLTDFLFIIYSDNSLNPIEDIIEVSDKLIKIDKIHSLLDIQNILSLPELELSIPTKHIKFNPEKDISIVSSIADDFTLDVLSNLNEKFNTSNGKIVTHPIKPKSY